MEQPWPRRSLPPSPDDVGAIVKPNGDFTIGDRLAVAFLNSLVALPTGTLLWLAANGFPWVSGFWLPAQAILWFAGVMALLGLVVNSAFLADFYGLCWRFLLRWFALSPNPGKLHPR